MDTPDSKSTSTTTTNNNNNNKLINLPSSDSPAFQESPIFSYLSNLSPIQPVKAAPVAQGFPGLSSPPLIFTSPRINSRLSFFNRQLRSSASNSEFSQDNDKCQKSVGDADDSAKLDFGLQSPSVPSNQKGCTTKKLEQVAHCSPSGCFDEFSAKPMECVNSLHKLQSHDVPQAIDIGSLEKKDNGNDKKIVPDSSAPLKVRQSGQAKSRISFKVVKNEPQHLISASSECSRILTKLPIGHTSELCQTGDSFSEASPLERGSLRRCLFDENHRKSSADGSGSWTSNENLTRIQEVANMSSSKALENSLSTNLPKPISGMCGSPSTGNCPVSVPKPLGIGLHLNSVVYPRLGSAVGGQQSSGKVVRVKGNNSDNQSGGKVNASSIPSNYSGNILASSRETPHNQASSVAMSGKPLASDDAEQCNNPSILKPDDPFANNPNILKPDDPFTIVYEKRQFNSELVESNEEFNPASPKKKRKKSSSTMDDDTSKRCNCKKTKCLKLYCDCFAAGFYCGESCACQGCCNRPENEDTVLETRQQIESRNPLAFAPKVLQPVTDSIASIKELANLSNPASARHKRGCNCKKSMCLKKYCECYQSNVGCSEGCRCEGCKNVYGKREEYSVPREFMIKVTEATPEGIDKKQEILAVSSNVLNSRAHASPHVTPVTPALLCSDPKKIAPKSRLPFRRFLPSPDSPPDLLPSEENFLSSPRNSPGHSMILEKSGSSLDVCALGVEKGCENSEDRLLSADASHSISMVPSSSSKARESINVSQPKSFTGCGLPPPSSHLRWRSSPMTPITQSAGSDYLQDFDSGSKHSDMLDDDTPEILRDSVTPVESVKVRSPNKKRISPPHSRIDSPESLRSSRKFVLQSVCGSLDRHTLPKFPPLTPYSRKSAVDEKSQSLDP